MNQLALASASAETSLLIRLIVTSCGGSDANDPPSARSGALRAGGHRPRAIRSCGSAGDRSRPLLELSIRGGCRRRARARTARGRWHRAPASHTRLRSLYPAHAPRSHARAARGPATPAVDAFESHPDAGRAPKPGRDAVSALALEAPRSELSGFC